MPRDTLDLGAKPAREHPPTGVVTRSVGARENPLRDLAVPKRGLDRERHEESNRSPIGGELRADQPFFPRRARCRLGAGAPSRAHHLRLARKPRRVGHADKRAERKAHYPIGFVEIGFPERANDDVH
jgi:hypothetical protein